MKLCFCLIIFFAFVLDTRAETFDFYDDGTNAVHTDYIVDAERISRLPHWKLEDYTPPSLELNDALKTVRALIQKQISPQEYHVQNVSIKRKETDNFGSIFFYEVSITRYKERDYSNVKHWTVIVLMDGTLLESDPNKL